MKDILEDFEMYNSLLTEDMNLRDVLGHKTGIPDYFVPLMAGLPAELTWKDVVK